MKSYKSNSMGDFLAANNSKAYFSVLATLGSILLFTLLYGLVVQFENELIGYMVLCVFSLFSGIVLNKTFSRRSEKQEKCRIYHQLLGHDSDIIQMVFKIKENAFVYVTNNVQEILAYQPSEISIPFLVTCIQQADVDQWMNFFDLDLLKEKESLTMDFKTSSKYGVISWMEWTAKAVLDERKNVDFIIFSVKDISQRKEKAQADKLYLSQLEKMLNVAERSA